MKHLYWARREINRLDPQKDAQRIAHLSFEVRYGLPIFTYGLFSMAFARQVAVPEIASVIYQEGKGSIMTNTRERNERTLTYFGLMYRYLGQSEGRKIIEQVVKMHKPHAIANELNLYTLATLATLPSRVGTMLIGKDILTNKESTASYYFWRDVGEIMGIRDIPKTPELMQQWCVAYEESTYKSTEAGRIIVAKLADDFADKWFPKFMKNVGKQAFYCLFDDQLLAVHQVQKPSKVMQGITRFAIRSFVFLSKLFPDPGERSLVETFGKGHHQLEMAKGH